MARKTKVLPIEAEGRDQGKFFFLTEMPASQAERWAVRAFLALARAGVDIPDNLREMGLAGIAHFGMQALGGVSFDDAQTLLDEMWTCVLCIPDPAKPEVKRQLVESDTEEVATRLFIKKEVFGLHVNFSEPVAP